MKEIKVHKVQEDFKEMKESKEIQVRKVLEDFKESRVLKVHKD